MENPHRLPRTATPSRYSLELEPDLPAATFAGTARITLEIHEPVRELVCNAAELEIDMASLCRPDGTLVPLQPTLDPALDRLHLSAEAELAPGPWDPLESTCRHASLSIL